jgi:hypothetical protein
VAPRRWPLADNTRKSTASVSLPTSSAARETLRFVGLTPLRARRQEPCGRKVSVADRVVNHTITPPMHDTVSGSFHISSKAPTLSDAMMTPDVYHAAAITASHQV